MRSCAAWRAATATTPRPASSTAKRGATSCAPSAGTPVPDQFPFSGPFFFLLDMQLGGKWVGKVDMATLPVEMQIDYIRIYEKVP